MPNNHVDVRCVLLTPTDEVGVYLHPDTGDRVALRDATAGMMWDAHWMGDSYRVNGSGPVLVVRLPNGLDWMPGSQSANCGRPGEDHDCWCVHGDAPVLTVDKTPEPGRSTCTAGAGSIGSGSGERYWHGFLRDGMLVVA
jgi:hypothetical protein